MDSEQLDLIAEVVKAVEPDAKHIAHTADGAIEGEEAKNGQAHDSSDNGEEMNNAAKMDADVVDMQGKISHVVSGVHVPGACKELERRAEASDSHEEPTPSHEERLGSAPAKQDRHTARVTLLEKKMAAAEGKVTKLEN
eukprot:jgi/Mesvir1/11564/Mv04618-RA.1